MTRKVDKMTSKRCFIKFLMTCSWQKCIVRYFLSDNGCLKLIILKFKRAPLRLLNFNSFISTLYHFIFSFLFIFIFLVKPIWISNEKIYLTRLVRLLFSLYLPYKIKYIFYQVKKMWRKKKQSKNIFELKFQRRLSRWNENRKVLYWEAFHISFFFAINRSSSISKYI